MSLCNEVAEDARAEFRELFKTIALSIDWAQEYHTISADTRKFHNYHF